MAERNTVARTRKKYIPGRGTIYVTERVPAPALPSLNYRTCLRIYDPLTRKEIPTISRERDPYLNSQYIEGLNIDFLKQRLDEIKRMISTSTVRISLFDPCTKRKVGTIEELDARIKEIECYKLHSLGEITHRSEGELQLQLHQEIIVNGINNTLWENYTKSERDNRFLIGVLPRGGKTFIAGGLMRMMQDFNRKNIIVLWITAAPNETKLQVEKELLGNFSDFTDYKFVAVRDAPDFTYSGGNTVFFVSSQLLTLAKLGVARERSFLSKILNPSPTDPKISLVFFDEAHKTGVGTVTKTFVNELIEQTKTRTMPFIFLTGTYARIQEDYKIPREHTYIWDYTDVLSARNLGTSEKHDQALKTLQERFGTELVDRILTERRCLGETEAQMVKSYADYPDLHFITGEFNPTFTTAMTDARFYSKESGLNMGNLLQIKEGATLADFKTKDNKIKSSGYRQFKHLDIVSSVFVPSLLQTLERVDSISRRRGSRYRFERNDSIMMFMPTGGKGTNIFFTLCAWASLLLYGVGGFRSNYEVVCVVENESLPQGSMGSNNEANVNISSEGIYIVSKNVKETILHLEVSAKERGKGLIVLAGEKMSMGVSLPFIDVVMMLNDKTAADDIIQKMYRAVTPSVGKTDAFIVDFSPKRTLAAIYGYTKLSSSQSLTPYEVYKILMNTYYWDDDLIQSTKHSLLYRDTFLSNLGKLYAIVASDEEYGEGDLTVLGKKRKEELEKELTLLLGEFRGEKHTRPELKINYSGLTNAGTLQAVQDYEYRKRTLERMMNEARGLYQTNNTAVNYNALRNATNNLNTARNNLVKFLGTKRATTKSKGSTRKLSNEQRAAKEEEKQRVAEAKAAEKAALKAAMEAAKLVEKQRIAEAKAAEKAAVEAARADAKAAEKQRIANAKAAAEAAKAAAKAAVAQEKARIKAEAAAAKTATRRRPRTAPILAVAPVNGNTTENED
jgi:hypothetical protein